MRRATSALDDLTRAQAVELWMRTYGPHAQQRGATLAAAREHRINRERRERRRQVARIDLFARQVVARRAQSAVTASGHGARRYSRNRELDLAIRQVRERDRQQSRRASR